MGTDPDDLIGTDPDDVVAVTKTGRQLTNADFEALADEAERGYDVSHLTKKDQT